MVIPRSSACWTARLVNQYSRSARAINHARSWQKAQRRTYADGGNHSGHGSHQSGFMSGDLPWAIGAGIVTVPSLWYLSQPQIERFQNGGKSHGGHGHGNDEHDEHSGEADGGEEVDEAGGDAGNGPSEEENENQDKGGQGDQGEQDLGALTEDSPDDSDSENGGKPTPTTPGDKGKDDTAKETESGGNVEGVQFKGATSGGIGDNNEQGDTRKHIPDAKGGSKKRIESDSAITQGEADSTEHDPHNEDKAASAKNVDDKAKKTQSGKQEGLSNTDTKHSTDIANDPDKSTKGEGGPETAKNKGTVQPSRPQV